MCVFLRRFESIEFKELDELGRIGSVPRSDCCRVLKKVFELGRSEMLHLRCSDCVLIVSSFANFGRMIVKNIDGFVRIGSVAYRI